MVIIIQVIILVRVIGSIMSIRNRLLLGRSRRRRVVLLVICTIGRAAVTGRIERISTAIRISGGGLLRRGSRSVILGHIVTGSIRFFVGREAGVIGSITGRSNSSSVICSSRMFILRCSTGYVALRSDWRSRPTETRSRTERSLSST